MPMDPPSMVAAGLSVVNVAFALALAVVWTRNYRTFGSPLLLGLVAFAVVMFVENAVAVYYFLSTGMLYAAGVQTTVVFMRVLQTVALAFLTWVTMQ